MAIAEPSFGKACGIVFVNGLISVVINILINLVVQNAPELAIAGLGVNLIAGFLVASLVYSTMLPTSFGRGALVYLISVLIMIVIAMLLGGISFAVTAFVS